MNLLQRLPHYSILSFRDAYTAANAAAIEAARNGLQADRDALQAAFTLAAEAEEHRIKGERKRIAALNAAAFLANPAAIIAELDEERGRTFDLGEMALIYGIASVTLKRAGRGTLVGKGTLGQGTISPFDATVRIGDRVVTVETASRNDRYSKDNATAHAATRALLQIAQGAA